MKIEVYAICYNEELIISYFLRHYLQFADIILYDNNSTDKSEEIAINAGAKITKYDSKGEIRDDIYLKIKNDCWKSSKADWVIICDIDEFIYHPNLVSILEKTESTIFRPVGYNMVTDKFPTTNGQIYEEVTMGVLDNRYSKLCLFKPSKITEINYFAGCHKAEPKGDVKLNIVSDIKLLHMRFLSKEYVMNKNSIYKQRLSNLNKKEGWGIEYTWGHQKMNDFFDEQFKLRKKII